MSKREKRPSKLLHFLIVFDHESGRVDVAEFGGDTAKAIQAYEDEERRQSGRQRLEIVLVGSDSLETVKLTHANYFKGTVATSKYLKGLE